ncbi:MULTISPECIES: ABC transporter substrate-binding protein [Halanaerobium]|jgi:ribose transport system substrate-binding protein|uniref:Ribose transport system substrate-binding protein n=1 Tax=Halanaerobium kushneri TaxID=56779 RepID=A0A1N6ZIK7_9FIRM|nr:MULTISPECIES: ABC transporter substrate-binding protein [Halanaerobium]RCW60341.1 ribose transport system substrate-binding protein [Halanaerobium sp. ST460_2HS_T2]SIR26556.1 ribose transport system substrate-binding protein [Halanaerobium kushneri]
MKKVSLLLVLLAVFMAFTGTAFAQDKPYVAIVSKGFQHQFWQAVRQGAEEAAQDYNVEITYEGPESESQVAVQIDMLQTAMDKDPDALVFAALDTQAALPLIEEAESKEIPIIAFDSGVDSDIPVTTAATDNYAASAYAADKMAELIGYQGKVAVIVHDQTSVTGVERRDGFLDRMKNRYPEIEVVDVQYGGGDHLKSTDLAKSIMEANPDLDGFFGANEGSAVGVVNGIMELGREDIATVGFDSGSILLNAIRNGIMDGAITQNPVGIGYRAVEAAVKAMNGEELPEMIDTGFYYYNARNMDSEILQPLLYE